MSCISQADSPFSTNVQCLFRARVWVPLTPPVFRTSGQLPHSYKPPKHPNQAPEPGCLMTSSLTRFHHRITPGVWNQPYVLDCEKNPHWFQCFSVTKTWARWQLWRYRGFSHIAKNVTSFIFYLKRTGSANKPQLWCEYKKINLKDDSLPIFCTARIYTTVRGELS